MVVVAAVAFVMQRNANVRWAREQALPEIIQLAGASNFGEAYRLAQQAEAYIPGDPMLIEQLRTISRSATIESEPSGAELFYRPYGTDSSWRSLGRTPIDAASVPRGLLHWRLSLNGFDEAEDVGPGPFLAAAFPFPTCARGDRPRPDGTHRLRRVTCAPTQ